MVGLLAKLRRWTSQQIRYPKLAATTDAVLASYPKSGRTWFRFILSNYFAEVNRLDAAIDLHTTFSVVPNLDLDPQRGLPAFKYEHLRPTLPKIAVSHLPYSSRLFQAKPVIFMVRDPRDVLVSSYFHATRHKHRFSGPIGVFLANPEQGALHLIRYLNGWAEGLPQHPHFILSYEALSAEPEQMTASVLSFLKLKPDAAAIRRAVEFSRFEAMREIEKSDGIPGHEYDRSDNESLRMRKGVAGGYTDYLSSREIAWIEKVCDAELSAAAKLLLSNTGVDLQPV
jgi:alcohol sulfotransferase